MYNNQFKLIARCDSAKDTWIILQIVYGGTSTIRESKLQMLTTRYKEIRMQDSETIVEFNSKMFDIANESNALGEKMSILRLIRKVLRSLPDRFAYKVCSTEEARNIKSLRLYELMGALETHELNMKRLFPFRYLAMKFKPPHSICDCSS